MRRYTMQRPMTGTRRFSEAISEGDGISVIVLVDDPEAARVAQDQGAEAVAVDGSSHAVHEAAQIPVLRTVSASAVPRAADADAVTLSVPASDELDAELAQQAAAIAAEGLDCVVAVRDEGELERVLEHVDPEILLLSVAEIESVLDLLADVPAGKLVIAQLSTPTREHVLELERAGVDAVIVPDGNVAELVGAAPPEV